MASLSPSLSLSLSAQSGAATLFGAATGFADHSQTVNSRQSARKRHSTAVSKWNKLETKQKGSLSPQPAPIQQPKAIPPPSISRGDRGPRMLRECTVNVAFREKPLPELAGWRVPTPSARRASPHYKSSSSLSSSSGALPSSSSPLSASSSPSSSSSSEPSSRSTTAFCLS